MLASSDPKGGCYRVSREVEIKSSVVERGNDGFHQGRGEEVASAQDHEGCARFAKTEVPAHCSFLVLGIELVQTLVAKKGARICYVHISEDGWMVILRVPALPPAVSGELLISFL